MMSPKLGIGKLKRKIIVSGGGSHGVGGFWGGVYRTGKRTKM